MTADGSMAVWSNHKVGAGGAAAEIHFNYWRISGDTSFVRASGDAATDFIELGILLDQAATIEQVKIYLPGPATVWRLEDCGPRFNSPAIAQGIFNKQLSCTAAGPPGPRRADLQNPDHSYFCRVHIFAAQNGNIAANELIQESVNSGVLLTITRHALDEACLHLPEGTPIYFRLRAYFVGEENSNPFVKRIRPKDRHLQTGYDVVDYLDFRLNEARSLPDEIEALARLETTAPVPIKLVAFLTAIPVKSDVTTISEAHKMRLLEHDLWQNYVASGIPRGMTVYHWKEVLSDDKFSVEDFSAFVKMQTRVVLGSTLFIAILIAFLFGIAGNLCASWIWDRWPSKVATSADAPSLAKPAQTPTQAPPSNAQKPETRQQ